MPQKEISVAKVNEELQPEPSTSEPTPELIYETNEEVIRDYNEWHMSFYGRNSPYYPGRWFYDVLDPLFGILGPPPILTPAPPNYLRAIQAAASYVAQHGPAAEQQLLGDFYVGVLGLVMLIL